MSQNNWQSMLSNWGGQTIAFAMSQRAMDLGKALDQEHRARAANVEAKDTAQRLWTEALTEAGDPIDPPKFQAGFVRRVFEWCREHLDG